MPIFEYPLQGLQERFRGPRGRLRRGAAPSLPRVRRLEYQQAALDVRRERYPRALPGAHRPEPRRAVAPEAAAAAGAAATDASGAPPGLRAACRRFRLSISAATACRSPSSVEPPPGSAAAGGLRTRCSRKSGSKRPQSRAAAPASRRPGGRHPSGRASAHLECARLAAAFASRSPRRLAGALVREPARGLLAAVGFRARSPRKSGSKRPHSRAAALSDLARRPSRPRPGRARAGTAAGFVV